MSLKQYQAYLFDLDGTLVDTAPDINAALNHALAWANLPTVDESLTRHWVGHGSRVLIDQALKHSNASAQAEPLLEQFLGFYENNLTAHSVIYPEVISTLQRLREGEAKLAVVTNKMERLSLPLLNDIGLTPYFDCIVCGDTASAPKPDPAPVHYALTHMGNISAANGLFVGDSETDVNAANAANMDVVCVRDGYHHGVDVSTLDVIKVIDHFGQLLP